jgi:hypothetical protein
MDGKDFFEEDLTPCVFLPNFVVFDIVGKINFLKEQP